HYERRQFSLRDIGRREYPVPADRYHQDQAKAVFRNGILRVSIPARGEGAEGGGIRIDIETE
ncbi:MAG TPA: Hsp20/alpha crystallin family protein, partial [Rectinemataceae bacterium]|nr:Hsp20/alpha crystallin family protein [Rectinemataceae bacterium]